MLKLVKRCLQREGYEVICAETGNEALHKLYEEGPLLIVLDINLPDLSGFVEVCKKIRNDSLYKHIPIVMLTIRNTDKDKIKRPCPR